MKIAFLNIYQGQVERGAERVIEELSTRLKKNNIVKVFGGEKIPPKRWPILWRLFLDPQGISIFWWTIKILPRIVKEGYEIVIPTNGGWQPALIRLITWLNGKRMIIIGHSGIGWDDKNNLWSFPDVFIAPSSYSKSWAQKVNPFIKVIYIPNGVDISKFSPFSQSIKNLKLNHPIILCVGALVPEKRLELAISAVSRLPKASLLIIGRGPLRNKISKMGNELLGERFKLTESDFKEIPAYYRIADIFTSPTSPWQSFELVILEAMATNLAIVANDDPVRREIVGDAGIYVNPEDIEGYAKALKKALSLKWEDKPRRRAEMFSWDMISSRYAQVFYNLVKK